MQFLKYNEFIIENFDDRKYGHIEYDDAAVSVGNFPADQSPERLQKFLSKVGIQMELKKDERGSDYLVVKVKKPDTPNAIKNNIATKLRNGGFKGATIYKTNIYKSAFQKNGEVL